MTRKTGEAPRAREARPLSCLGTARAARGQRQLGSGGGASRRPECQLPSPQLLGAGARAGAGAISAGLPCWCTRRGRVPRPPHPPGLPPCLNMEGTPKRPVPTRSQAPGTGHVGSGRTRSPTTSCPHQRGGGVRTRTAWSRVEHTSPCSRPRPLRTLTVGSPYFLLGPAQGSPPTRPLGDKAPRKLPDACPRRRGPPSP